jgi:general secretion pathway protein K
MNRRASANSRSGIVLVAVLLLIAVLAVIIVEFNYESRIRLHLADNYRRATQALNCAEAGIAISMAALRKSDNLLADYKLRPLLFGQTQIPFDDGSCTISITDESGKIDINAFKTSENRIMRQRVEQMLRLIDLLNQQYEQDSPISYSLVPAIFVWVDFDDDVTVLPFVQKENSGAENSYYQNLADPYSCKNTPFDMLSELLLVKGMTEEIFHGRAGDEEKGLGPIQGMQQFLTIYGDGRININEAPATVIQSLSDRISRRLANNIAEQRKVEPYQSVDQLQEVPGMTSEIYQSVQGLVTVKPKDRYYTVTATGVAGPFVRKIRLVVRKDGQTAQVIPVLRREL